MSQHRIYSRAHTSSYCLEDRVRGRAAVGLVSSSYPGGAKSSCVCSSGGGVRGWVLMDMWARGCLEDGIEGGATL